MFFLLKGLLFLSDRTLTSLLERSRDELETNLSFLLATTDSNWKEKDRFRIAGHKPSGALVFAIHLELFGSSVAASRTGVTGLDAGVVGLDTLEEEVEGDEGLLLSADCALLDTAVPSVVEVRTRLGDVHRLVLVAAAIPVLYLDATSFPRKALCFSDGTSGGLDVSSKRAAFFTLFLRASMMKSQFQNKPHQCDRMKVALCSADLPKICKKTPTKQSKPNEEKS
jgi:hypothetical protein